MVFGLDNEHAAVVATDCDSLNHRLGALKAIFDTTREPVRICPSEEFFDISKDGVLAGGGVPNDYGKYASRLLGVTEPDMRLRTNCVADHGEEKEERRRRVSSRSFTYIPGDITDQSMESVLRQVWSQVGNGR